MNDLKLRYWCLIWVVGNLVTYLMIQAQQSALIGWTPNETDMSVPLEGLDIFILAWFVVGSLITLYLLLIVLAFIFASIYYFLTNFGKEQ